MDINLTIIGQTIAMVVFVSFCMKYIWPPLIQAIDDRRKEIADGLAAGEQASKDLEEAKVKADQIIAEAREQALGIVDQANKRGAGIVEEARDDGKRERERQIAAAQADIEQQVNTARDELRATVADLAVSSAEKILDREIDANAHRDLLSRLASQI